MKDMRALVLAGVFLAMCATASAQEPRWTDPTGHYSLALGSDWNELPLDPSEPKVVMAAEYLPGNARGQMRMCSVRVLANVAPRPGLTQQSANVLVEQMNEERARGTFPQGRNHSVTHSTLDGVAIADAFFDDVEANFYTHTRLFTVLAPERVLHVHILCGGTLPVGEADKAAITAFVSTLRFSGLDQTP